MRKKLGAPSPALVVAMIALFVALSGTALAAGVVPLAKRALLADNAKKLGGQTSAQMAARPGPASTAAGLLSIKTTQWSLTPGQGSEFAVTCDSGQKAVSGGFEDPQGWAHPWDSRPTSDGAGWRTFVMLSRDAPAAQSGTLYTVCLR